MYTTYIFWDDYIRNYFIFNHANMYVCVCVYTVCVCVHTLVYMYATTKKPFCLLMAFQEVTSDLT